MHSRTSSSNRSPRASCKASPVKARIRRVSDLLERSLGKPAQRRRFSPPLDVLIATVLSQHTNDKNSHRAYAGLRRAFPTWKKVGEASLPEIESAIREGGMAAQKARTIRHILRTVKGRHGVYSLSAMKGQSNDQVMEELLGLKGVGVKTAACVLLFAMGHDVFPVDVHVHRLCRRLGLVPGTASAEETFSAVSPLVPDGRSYALHTNLIRLGRTVCRPRDPKCAACPLYDQCLFEGKPNAHPARP